MCHPVGVTILIDEARWWFREERWCHLVSDTSIDELQEFADAAGGLSEVRGGTRTIFEGGATPENIAKFEAWLTEVFSLPGAPLDRVDIRAAPDLRYDETMRIIDLCKRQKLSDGEYLRAVNFTELTAADQQE